MTNELAVKASIDLGDNVSRLIEQLATQIGVTADKVFPWYVQQSVIEGWGFCIMMMVLLVIFLPLFFVACRKADWGEENGWCPVQIVAGIVLGMTLIVAACGSIEFISHILNPNYHAMKQIINDFSQLAK